MGLLSKIKGADKRERKIMIQIDATELRKGEMAEAWAQAGELDTRPDVLKMFVGGAIESMGEPHTSRIKNIELHLAPDGEKFFVVLATSKMTSVEAAEFEAVAAERLSRLGARVR
jgi:hypothetical protein